MSEPASSLSIVAKPEEGTVMTADVISKLEEARKIIRDENSKDRFSIHARFSGGQCICGNPIQEGELITRIFHCFMWIHLKCAELELATEKSQSKAFTPLWRLRKPKP